MNRKLSVGYIQHYLVRPIQAAGKFKKSFRMVYNLNCPVKISVSQKDIRLKPARYLITTIDIF